MIAINATIYGAMVVAMPLAFSMYGAAHVAMPMHQVAMIVAPLIALAAPLVGAATFTLVLSPLLLAVMFMAVFIAIVVVSDGQSTWFEGAALITLYLGIATAFWWG